MKSSKTETKERRFLGLKPVIIETFHIPTMTKIITGSFWNKSTKALQDQLVDKVAEITAATYVTQFSSFSDQLFEISSEINGPQDTVLVNTQIISPGKAPVPIIYVMRSIQSKIGVIDILLGNRISELAKKRSEYRQSLRSNGLQGLVTTLDRKLTNMLSQ